MRKKTNDLLAVLSNGDAQHAQVLRGMEVGEFYEWVVARLNYLSKVKAPKDDG